MSAAKILKTINREIERINDEIDLRIIHGLPYGREARRHRELTQMLSNIRKELSVRKFSFTHFMF